MPNILSLPDACALQPDKEFLETLLSATTAVRVERIVSHGHTTPEGDWYDQEQDEWVVVLAGTAKIGYEDGKERVLAPGDHLFLPKHQKHRVTHTSSPCIWLAIFADTMTMQRK